MGAEHIPVIDISRADQETGDQLVEAVHRWGFAFVKGSNTGFSAPLIDDIFELVFPPLSKLEYSMEIMLTATSQSKAFFKSPLEEKEACAISSNVPPA